MRMSVVKVKCLAIHQKEGYDCYYDYQRVNDESGKTLFHVNNLADCPEDAIIGRCLFDANDWVRAVEYGMGLAKQGYDEIRCVTIDD